MRKKTTRDYEKQIGGFVPNGVVRGQSKRERFAPEPAPEPEVTPEPETVLPVEEKKEKK